MGTHPLILPRAQASGPWRANFATKDPPGVALASADIIIT